LRELFDEYDKDGSEHIDRFEFIELVKDLGMHLQTVEDRDNLMKKVEDAREKAVHACVSREEAGEPNDPKIPWLVFVQFVRMIRNQREEEELLMEETAAAQTGFSPEEISEFRDVFTYWVTRHRELATPDFSVTAPPEASNDNSERLLKGTEQPAPGTLEDPYLPYDGLRRILRSFKVELTRQHDIDLEVKVKELASESPRAIEAAGRLGFPEFLVILKWMLDKNFAGINGRLREIAATKANAAKAAREREEEEEDA